MVLASKASIGHENFSRSRLMIKNERETSSYQGRSFHL